MSKHPEIPLTQHVRQHYANAYPAMSHIISASTCDELQADEKAALAFQIAAFFFGAAAFAAHIARGGDPDLPISPELLRELGGNLSETYLDNCRHARGGHQ